MRSTWRTLEATLGPEVVRDVALVCVADALVGASFGAITVSGGLPLWLPIALSLLVFAGGAQFAAVGAILAGGSAASGVLAGAILNARLLPFGFAMSDALGPGLGSRLLGAHVITDESVAFTLRESDPTRRRVVFWTCGLGLFVCWNLAVAAGSAAGRAFQNTDALGLDAAFPAVLLALVVPALPRRTRRAASLGALLAVLSSPLLPPGLPVLVSLLGLVALRRGDDTDADAATGTGGPGDAAEAS